MNNSNGFHKLRHKHDRTRKERTNATLLIQKDCLKT
jgi:hypothetical protein